MPLYAALSPFFKRYTNFAQTLTPFSITEMMPLMLTAARSPVGMPMSTPPAPAANPASKKDEVSPSAVPPTLFMMAISRRRSMTSMMSAELMFTLATSTMSSMMRSSNAFVEEKFSYSEEFISSQR